MSKCEAYREQKRRLETFLGISKTPEDEYLHYSDLRAKGSCDWLTEKHSFQDWRDSGSSKIYWLSANPASGKSVLAAHVINHLEDANLTCSYFFFTRDSKSDSNLSNCLRSIAYQMALSNVYIRDNFLSMVDESLQIAKDDFRAIWRKVFIGGIFRTVLYQPYFWVLDGLDECPDRHELIRKLGEIEQTYPLRIFVTSRPSVVPGNRSGLEEVRMHVETISGEDSVDDIRLLIEANMDQFPAKDDNARQDLIEKIIDKAAGCFLWVRLVVDELREVYSPKDVKRILDSVPAGMDALYSRILKNMEQAQYGKEVAKAILTWTVLSARPLKVEELQAALQLDIEDTVHNLEESVASICGHLVYVDAQSRVRMIHQTAREFLLQPNLESEFALKASCCHSRLAKICLEYLRGDEMKAPRGRRSSIPRLLPKRSPFADYACSSFYEHIRGTSSSDGHILTLLSAFLGSSNVLCWIENVAQSGNLNHLVRTGRILKDFLRRRIKYASPLGNESQNVNAWSIDLLRLASKFGQQISIAPWSIYNLVPPFCPPQSALHKQFGTSSHCITVKGLSAESWDDRLSCHVFPDEQTSSIACTDGFYAVGYSSGLIVLYHTSACQLSRKMHHGEHIKSMKFSYSSKLLASGGMTNVQVFNVHTGERVLKLDTSHQCLAIHFNNHDRTITAALRNNETMTWEVPSGSLLSSTKLVDQPSTGQQSVAARAPTAAAFSQELDLLAVVFRAAPIMLWDLQSDSFYGYCDRESKNEPGRRAATSWPLDAVFNPAPNTSLLAATYWDGELLLFDPWEDEIKERTLAEGEVLACSPDGRTLATGDSGGNIQLFEFETLKLIYRINSWDYGIRSLAFSHDNLRFIDIRGSQCNVWEPSQLIRQDPQDQNSDSDALSSAAKEIDLVDVDDLVMITAVAVHPQGRFVICGKDDGSVCLYDAQTGLQHQRLYSHIQGVAITHLELDMRSGLIASDDASSTVMVYRISQKPAFGVEGPIMRIRREEPISQLLIQSPRLLISTPSAAFLYSIDGQHLKSYSRKQRDTTSADSGNPGQILPAQDSEDTWRWLSSPVHPGQVILVDGNRAAVFTMQSLEALTNLELPPDPRPQDTGVSIASFPLPAGLGNRTPQTIIPCFGNQYLAMSSPSPNPLQPPSLYIWPFASSLSPPPLTTASHSRLPGDAPTHLSAAFSRILGSLGPKLIFLDRNNWVSSIELAADHYARHFFIPFDWLSMNHELLVQVTQTVVVFVKRNEIAVVRNAFGFTEYIPIG
jgi:WD40 repeat protein